MGQANSIHKISRKELIQEINGFIKERKNQMTPFMSTFLADMKQKLSDPNAKISDRDMGALEQILYFTKQRNAIVDKIDSLLQRNRQRAGLLTEAQKQMLLDARKSFDNIYEKLDSNFVAKVEKLWKDKRPLGNADLDLSEENFDLSLGPNICNSQSRFNTALYKGLKHVQKVETRGTANMVFALIWLLLLVVAVMKVRKMPPGQDKALHFVVAVLFPPLYLLGDWVAQ